MMKDDGLSKSSGALDMLFSGILEPVALYRVLRDEAGDFKDVVYIDVNCAYELIMQVKRSWILGKAFHEVWSDREKEWYGIILQVARTGIYARYEGLSSDTGRYLHALAFSPSQDIVAVIFLDMTDWKEAESALVQKERLLTEYRQELRRLAAELSIAEERTRRALAVKLHDRIGYSLVSLLSELRTLSSRTNGNTAQGEASFSELHERLEHACIEVESLLQDTRSLTLEISSPLLYEVGLEAALESLADRMLTPRNITFDFKECGPKTEIEINNRILIYQMTQELLLNVIKHAKATHVVLRVQRGKKRVRVLVEDNGRGFSVDRDEHWGKWSGIGLFSIRERLHSMGGELRILTEKGQGCSVSLLAPVAFKGEELNEKTDIDG